MDFEHGRNWLAEIAVMLFSLASMAQFAISASPRKRRELLDIIRLGEASGIRVAIGEGLLEADHSFEPTQGYGPEDALRLAVSLRALAMVLHFRAKLDDQPRDRRCSPSNVGRVDAQHRRVGIARIGKACTPPRPASPSDPPPQREAEARARPH